MHDGIHFRGRAVEDKQVLSVDELFFLQQFASGEDRAIVVFFARSISEPPSSPVDEADNGYHFAAFALGCVSQPGFLR